MGPSLCHLRARPARGAGVTLLEFMTTLTVGAVILGGIFAMLLVSQVSSAETLTISKVEYGAKLSVLKIQNDVIDSGLSSPDWSLPEGQTGGTLTFNRCTGTQDGARVWSPPITYQKDGSLLVRTSEGTQTLIGEGIQELTFSLHQGVLRVAVSAHGQHRDRFSYDAAAAVDVSLRN
jgi:hypothetical protein